MYVIFLVISVSSGSWLSPGVSPLRAAGATAEHCTTHQTTSLLSPTMDEAVQEGCRERYRTSGCETTSCVGIGECLSKKMSMMIQSMF